MRERTKFKVVHMAPAQRNGVVAHVRLEAVVSDSAYNKPFFRGAPSAEITLGPISPEIAEQFAVGKAYYVDFSDAGD